MHFFLSLLGCFAVSCLVVTGVSVGSIVAFAKSLEAAQVYYVEDNEPKVKLMLRFGAFSYTVVIPAKETYDLKRMERD